jgi:hypothetical protein
MIPRLVSWQFAMVRLGSMHEAVFAFDEADSGAFDRLAIFAGWGLRRILRLRSGGPGLCLRLDRISC